jgi:hypothetical protein
MKKSILCIFVLLACFSATAAKVPLDDDCALVLGEPPILGLDFIKLSFPAHEPSHSLDWCTSMTVNATTVISAITNGTCLIQVTNNEGAASGGPSWMYVDPVGTNNTLIVQFCSYGPAWVLYMGADQALKLLNVSNSVGFL